MAGTITALEPQKRNANRINVYIDGTFSFGLAAIEAARLRVGQHLSDEEIATLRHRDEVERAKEVALHFLSYRPRSEAEIARHLAKKGFTRQAIDEAIERLRNVGLIDDMAFAQFWVENRERFRPRSHYALRTELRQKGIPDPIIDTVLQTVDETESAVRALRDKLNRWAHLDETEFYRKAESFLQRRGFSYTVLSEAIRQILAERDAGETPPKESEE